MHGDLCPSASVVSGTLVEPGKEAAYENQWIFCYSASYSEHRPSSMCGHRAHNLLVLRSQQFSFTLRPRSSCRHKSVLAICMFLSYSTVKIFKVWSSSFKSLREKWGGPGRPSRPASNGHVGSIYCTSVSDTMISKFFILSLKYIWCANAVCL